MYYMQLYQARLIPVYCSMIQMVFTAPLLFANEYLDAPGGVESIEEEIAQTRRLRVPVT